MKPINSMHQHTLNILQMKNKNEKATKTTFPEYKFEPLPKFASSYCLQLKGNEIITT